MSQTPATGKAHRRLLRTAATIAGPRTAARLPGLAPSETAALARRAAAPAHRPADPEVIFLLPLVGRHHVGDWPAVEGRLARTLASFTAQTDTRWRALICGQDRPALPDDPRIRFLPFAQEVAGNDKWPKLAALARALPDHAAPQGYAMPFDADDLLHSGAVAEMRARRTAGGYLAATGYVRNVATGAVALAGPPTLAQPLRKPFWKLCGSCAAFAYDLAEGPVLTRFLEAATQHEHRMFPDLAALSRRPLAPLSRASVLYELNHGENFGARRGRTGFKTRFVDRFAVPDPATALAGFPA